MLIVFISDIHGMPGPLRKVFGHIEALRPERIVMLGDLLYHGPRNGISDRYNPPETAAMLNRQKEHILAVRGNCDAEVDQALLRFPIMAEYAELVCERRFFLSHGHLWNEHRMPDLPAGAILAHGHTHVPGIKVVGGITIFNPGSISLPRDGGNGTFGVFDGKILSVRDVETGAVIHSEG